MQKKVKILLFSMFLAFCFADAANSAAAEVTINPEIKDHLAREELYIQGYRINTVLLNGIYSNFNYKSIWHGGNEVFNNNGRKAIEFLSKAEENGLDPADYSIRKINNRLKNLSDKNIPDTDILITQMFINLISDIANGRRIESDWEIEYYLKRKPRVVNYLVVVNDFLNSDDVDEFVDEYSPKHQGYHNLKNLLVKLLAERDTVSRKRKIPFGPAIYPGTKDYRISMIRHALGNPMPINPNQDVVKNLYDKSLQKEVLNVQKKFGLKTDGIIGNKTITALNTGPKELIKIIKANMERYRWFSEEFTEDRIEVNVPEFRLRAYEDGEEKLSLTTIVGRQDKKTPIIATIMTDVVFHPYWYVPREYGATQILPQIKENPENYLIDEEYTLIDNSDGKWEAVDPATIDWEKMTPEEFNYVLRQDPGSKNALGPMKFNILNNLSIYLHGTTKPWLFEKRVRSYSSGCIRIDGPQKLAYFVLKHNADYNQEEIDEILRAYDNDYEIPYYKKPVHKKITLEKQVATYITYFTIKADENGNYQLFDDIYGWDSLI